MFPFTANDKIEDINGCPKNRSQMVSGSVGSVCVRLAGRVSERPEQLDKHSDQKLLQGVNAPTAVPK